MQEELTALEPELKQKSKETEELMERLAVDQEKADQVRSACDEFRTLRERGRIYLPP